MSLSNYKAAKSQIALEALSMAPETTATIECPICQGGQSREKKLSVTRTHDGALFCCFRASCGFRGFVSAQGGQTMAPIRKLKDANPYTGPINRTYALDALAGKFMAKYKGFAPTSAQYPFQQGLGFTDEGDYVFECRGMSGKLRGHVTRTSGKKIKTFKLYPDLDLYASYFALSWPVHKATPIVVVEDCISGMAVASHGYDSLALLGTNLPSRLRDELKATGRRLLVMLDPDAVLTGISLAAKLGAQVATNHIKDPKDMPNLGEFLEQYI